MGRCKQKQCGLRGLLCRWPSITEWEMYISAQCCRLRNDLYCVEWDVKLYYTIPYYVALCCRCSLRPCEVVLLIVRYTSPLSVVPLHPAGEPRWFRSVCPVCLCWFIDSLMTRFSRNECPMLACEFMPSFRHKNRHILYYFM